MSRSSIPSNSAAPGSAALGLIGSGGHARVVSAAANRQGLVLAAAFDTDPQRIGKRIAGVEILPEAAIGADPDLPLHLGIGDNAVRRRLSTSLGAARWLTIIDPRACLAEGVTLGEGCFVNMGAVLQVGVGLGRHVIVNTGAVVDHDCQIGDFAHVAPGAVLCGGVTIGIEVLVGAGSVVLPGITVGDGAVIGAGAVVTHDVPAAICVTGSPARSHPPAAGSRS